MTNRTCTIDGCANKYIACGYCGTHYGRWKKYGDPNKVLAGQRGICSVDGCERKLKSRGMCSMHYKRQHRERGTIRKTCEWCKSEFGTYSNSIRFCSKVCSSTWTYATGREGKRKTTPLSDAWEAGDMRAFLDLVKANCDISDDGCWEWQGNLNKSGYALIYVRKSLIGHRITFEAFHGSGLGGMDGHHTCANRICVNPEHIQPATRADNVAEMKSRRSFVARINDLEAALREVSPDHPILRVAIS